MVNTATETNNGQTSPESPTSNLCLNKQLPSRSLSSNGSSVYVPLMNKIQEKITSSTPFFSLEFFPPKTVQGAVNLVSRFDKMSLGGPLFCDITWHAAGNPGGDSESSSITIASVALNYCGMETMLHITAVNLKKDDLRAHLERAKSLGIRNILALRGDHPNANPEYRSDFKYAIDVIRFIRQEYGDYFVICCSGYPTGHPEAASYEADLLYLKEKVEAGANFVITQLFFQSETFIKFVNDCRKIGIDVPILPGIMPIHSYDTLMKIVGTSQLEVPKCLQDAIEPIKSNDEAVQKFGIDWAAQMCRELMDSQITPGLHFYTLNRETATIEICKRLGLWCISPQKPLPWRPPANHKRCTEDVRPIFWSSRPKSYIYRTQTWDEFPNGRWGHSDSPAFGDLKDYYLFLNISKRSTKQLLNMWGNELTCEEDIWHVFYCYVTAEKNKNGYEVKGIPWNDQKLEGETKLIRDQLALLNQRGFLTINSQPNVNGKDSTDPVVGWGSSGGYVYQKAYLEFFTSKENVQALKKVLENYPSVNYHIVNKQGTENLTNCHTHKPIAVTWGVFSGSEIIQPTVVDPESFQVWKDEAFELWKTSWATLYPEDSQSHKLLENVCNNYYLVNLVDNDYPKECCLWKLLDDVFQLRAQDNEKAQTSDNKAKYQAFF